MLTEDLMEGLSSKLILVIDDQNSMRSVIRSYFHNMGFERVKTAIDGKDGLNFLMQNPVDLVVCDWHMPKICGLELLHLVRKSEGAAELPFLMVTSTSDIEAVKNAVQSGVSDYMIKPFKPAQLGFKVVQLLSKSTYKAKKLPVDISSLESSEGVLADKTEEKESTLLDDDGNPIDLEDVI